MRVEELIEKLKEYDRQDVVVISTNDDTLHRTLVVKRYSENTILIEA